MSDRCHLRYVPGSKYDLMFHGTVRYPRHEVTYEQAEQMRQAMPNPDAFEICEEGQ